MGELDYESLPGVATEILQARKVLCEKLKKNNLEDGPCLESTKRGNGPVIAIIHVIPGE